MRVRMLAVVAALVTLATGCTPKLDASSPEAFAASVKKVVESSPEKDRPELRTALGELSKTATAGLIVGVANKKVGDDLFKKNAQQLDGLTAEQALIIYRTQKAAEEKKRDENDLRYATEAVESASALLQRAQARQQMLAKLKVVSFDKQFVALADTHPLVSVSLQNDLAEPVDRFTLEVRWSRIAPDGRTTKGATYADYGGKASDQSLAASGSSTSRLMVHLQARPEEVSQYEVKAVLVRSFVHNDKASYDASDIESGIEQAEMQLQSAKRDLERQQKYFADKHAKSANG